MKRIRISKKIIRPKKFETHIIGSDNSVTRVLAGSESQRIYVPYNRMPRNLIHAIVAVEDRRFFHHHGIDLIGLLRSTSVVILSMGRRLQGGSTITQQLIKNTCFPDWYTNSTFKGKLKRKKREIVLAIKLERFVSKEDIIENYLNEIYFGNGKYGVQAASKYYFNKNVWELSLRECSILAGIPLSPAVYNPFSDLNKCMSRSSMILYKMYSQHRISRKQYIEARKDDIRAEINKRRKEMTDTDNVYSFFEEALFADVKSSLMKKYGISHVKAVQLLYSGGLRILSAENRDIQRFCENVFNDPDFIPDLDSPDGPEAAMLLMDSESGHVLTTVGGRGKKEASLIFNRATSALRNHHLKVVEEFFDRTEYTHDNPRGICIQDICQAYSSYENDGLTGATTFYKIINNYKGKTLLTDKEISKIKAAERLDNEKEHSTIYDMKYPLPQLIELTLPTDIWAVGRVGKLILGVWGGYDDNRPLPLKEEYYTYPRRIWKEISKYIEKKIEKETEYEGE